MCTYLQTCRRDSRTLPPDGPDDPTLDGTDNGPILPVVPGDLDETDDDSDDDGPELPDVPAVPEDIDETVLLKICRLHHRTYQWRRQKKVQLE